MYCRTWRLYFTRGFGLWDGYFVNSKAGILGWSTGSGSDPRWLNPFGQTEGSALRRAPHVAAACSRVAVDAGRQIGVALDVAGPVSAHPDRKAPPACMANFFFFWGGGWPASRSNRAERLLFAMGNARLLQDRLNQPCSKSGRGESGKPGGPGALRRGTWRDGHSGTTGRISI